MSIAKIPEGFATITPTLALRDATKAIDLYKQALGAQELYRMPTPDGKVMHACLLIGNSKLFLCDFNPEMGCGESSSSFYLYVNDVDSAASQAKKAGLEETSPVQDMFWGDRVGMFKDAFGIRWSLATHVRDVSQDDMQKAMKQMCNKAA